jgi:hypothetical protein
MNPDRNKAPGNSGAIQSAAAYFGDSAIEGNSADGCSENMTRISWRFSARTLKFEIDSRR